MKRLNYYVLHALVAEKPQTVIMHIGSNDIRKRKWLLGGIYHPPSQPDQYFF